MVYFSRLPRRARSMWVAGLILGSGALVSCEKIVQKPQSAPIISEETVVIDSTALPLVSDSAALAQGILKFMTVGSPPEIVRGHVLVGAERGGFLRRVETVSVSADTLVITTSPASLDEIIERGSFEVSTKMSLHDQAPAALTRSRRSQDVRVIWSEARLLSAVPGVTIGPDGITLTDVVLYSSPNGTVELSIPSGRVRFDPDVDIGVTYEGARLQAMHAIATGELSAGADVAVTAASGWQDSDKLVLWTVSKQFVALVGNVPVPGEVRLEIVAEFESAFDVGTTVGTGFMASSSLTFGTRYSERGWSLVSETSPSFTGRAPTWDIESTANARVKLEPVVSTRFFYALPVLDYEVASAGLEIEPEP